ncbi:MAG: peptidase T [Desulfobacteraceae bacterium]|nr:peptidase T [Desulfobacteraceae bacterium]MBC2749431.1 peptidase T [Desulfobacteraceae bacterium]
MPPENLIDYLQPRAVERFLRYVALDSTADPESGRHPSSEGQLALGALLADELKQLGLLDIEHDAYGYVYAVLPGRHAKSSLSLTFCAHLDTSPSVSGAHVRPVVHRSYDGGPIHFPDDPDLRLTPAESPELLKFTGSDIITAAGRTLLGADDKAGLAAIMTALEALQHFKDWPHPELRIVFTPDEEISQGTAFIQRAKLGDIGYTIDGGEMGELETECFHALKAVLTFHGMNVHPGYAKNRMVNAGTLAARFIAGLPAAEAPEHTEGREGFFHVTSLSGNESQATVEMILRDFDAARNRRREKLLQQMSASFETATPGLTIDLRVSEQYRNMHEVLARHPDVARKGQAAIEAAGIPVINKAIRGGTDGAHLCFMGLPTPNLFAGGLLFHSRKEWIPVIALAKSPQVILTLCRLWAEDPPPLAASPAAA